MKFQFSRAFNFGVALVSGIIFGNATIGLAVDTGSSLLNGGIIKPSNERLAPEERFKQNYLIAASPQLDNLLYNFSFKYSNTVRYYKVTSPDHYAGEHPIFYLASKD